MAKRIFTAVLLIIFIQSSQVAEGMAGANAGATARLSWSPDSLVTDLPSPHAGVFRIFILMDGIRSATAVSYTLDWTPSNPGFGYTTILDSIGREPCLTDLRATPGGEFRGDSDYAWTLGPITSGPSLCFSRYVSASSSEPAPARFCLTEVYVADDAGAIDPVIALNSATIGGGGGEAECLPHIYSVSPETFVGTPAYLNISGNALSQLTSVHSLNSTGHLNQGRMIGESDVNSALVVFDRLDGGGPWDLIPISNVGEGGVLKSALRRAILLGAEIARSDRGKIYWYGNELSPPYVIRIADDRAQLLVNELPTRVVSRPPVPADTSFAMRKYKLGRRVMAARSQLSSRGYTGTELMGQLASLYQAETDLVESVRVISDQSLGVVWRGIPGEMTVRVLDRDVDPSAALQSLKLRGEELARLLDSGALVFFGAGEFVVPPSRVAQAESEVAAIRNQQSASEQSIIRNPRIREQLANPRSIDELLKENE